MFGLMYLKSEICYDIYKTYPQNLAMFHSYSEDIGFFHRLHLL